MALATVSRPLWPGRLARTIRIREQRGSEGGGKVSKSIFAQSLAQQCLFGLLRMLAVAVVEVIYCRQVGLS